ncbi:hypothetical protein PRZ48_007611 [Zasmidium cellare]|uniref:2EXR domain-containing protein n=1 Tax=Zasmidium cellare TaxID=395010 RepID=A0ABR0EJS5_ZASCE|nr:hypothetical protein PRZ48_007611 [Zasmidium cellare]
MDNSPFNKLSAEIRNQIWELALASDQPILRIGHPFPMQPLQLPPLTRTSKQIRAETRLLYYTANAVSGTILTNDPANTNPDQAFRQSVDMIISWARTTTPPWYHKAIGTLELYIPLYYMTWDHESWDARTGYLCKLRDELLAHGYEKGRVLINVKIRLYPDTGLPTGLPRLYRKPLKENRKPLEKEIKKFFAGVGFECVVTD